MQITSFGTRTAMAVTTVPALVEYTCNAQGLWGYVPGNQTASVVFSLSATASAIAEMIGELIPGESDVIAVAQSAGIDIYAFTRSGTSILSVGGIQ